MSSLILHARRRLIVVVVGGLFLAPIVACEYLERAGVTVQEDGPKPAGEVMEATATSTDLADTAAEESVEALTLRDLKKVSDGWEYTDQMRRFTAHIDNRGTVAFRKSAIQGPGPAAGGKILRFVGPAELAEKLRGEPDLPARIAFMNRSEALRRQIMLEGRKSDIHAATQALEGQLREIWRNDKVPAPARRETLFERWDECAETGDAEQVQAGNAARAAILDFIVKTIPAGSPDAFGEAELKLLNGRRHSTTVFAPYTSTKR